MVRDKKGEKCPHDRSWNLAEKASPFILFAFLFYFYSILTPPPCLFPIRYNVLIRPQYCVSTNNKNQCNFQLRPFRRGMIFAR